tara:strand:+ start:66 stop:1025 length:960 start_codon:yes stop_codon:yes gene_type:complete
MQTATPIKQLKRDFTTRDSNGNYDRKRAQMIRRKDPEKAEGAWRKIADIIKEKSSQLETVLDIGCGTGRYFDSVYAKNLYGLDGSYEMLERARYHWATTNPAPYEEWAAGDWVFCADWPLQDPWPSSCPPPSIRRETSYDNLTLIHDDVMDFCKREEYRNKFDYVYCVAMLGIGNITVDPYALIPLIPNLTKNNAEIFLHIDMCGLCRYEESGELDREKDKIESLLVSMQKEGALKRYEIRYEVTSVTMSVNGQRAGNTGISGQDGSYKFAVELDPSIKYGGLQRYNNVTPLMNVFLKTSDSDSDVASRVISQLNKRKQ